ncbi:kinase-like domain-containing protein [Infundibulicybe gibba]|nr:kinase-like domain-containing protein [Infundibulicybe gibba]
MTVQDNQKALKKTRMSAVIESVEDCLLDVKTKMEVQGFTRQREIAADIEHCHNAISACLAKFQLISHTELHNWQAEFAMNAENDRAELVKYLSEIQNSQTITNEALNTNTEMMRELMGMMQTLMRENIKSHAGISSNLYQLQRQSGELLPNFYLKSGEVTRTGQYPVDGTSAMDIYEGLYLGNEKVAVKVIRAVHANEHSLRRLNREVKIWAEIWRIDRGKHILPFYGFCQDDGPYPYTVSPWQPNGNALTYVKKNKVDHRELIKGIALGIEVLHSMSPPVVHGDLKSANIAINKDGKPLIADFGLSKVVEDITGVPFTQSCGILDSSRWFAPELSHDKAVLSTKSDIYAFGMTMLEVMTHEPPFSEIKRSSQVIIRSSRGETPRRPKEPLIAERGLNDRLWLVLTKCWSLDPVARPSIKELIMLLSHI